MSFANLVLYGRVIPNIGNDKESDADASSGIGETERTLCADNPNDWEEIKKFYKRRKKSK